MRLVNPKASTFLAILESFCSGVCVRELLAYGTSAPIGRITSFSAKFTDAPLAEGKFETYLHERENAKKPQHRETSTIAVTRAPAADSPAAHAHFVAVATAVAAESCLSASASWRTSRAPSYA